MERPLYKISVAIGLMVYVLIIAFLAAHFMFPYRQAALVVKQQIESDGPLRLEFEGPEPRWPLFYRIKLAQVAMATPMGNLPLIGFDRIDIRWQPFSLFSGEAGALFQAMTAQGHISGHLAYQLTDRHDLRIVVREIDLPDFRLDEPTGKGGVNGHLSGEIEVLGQGKIVPTGGQGIIKMTSGRLHDLKIPDLPLTELDFDLMEIKFKLEKTQVIIEKMIMESPQGGFTLNGRIQDYRHPILHLTGSAHMGPADKPILSTSFRITGPLFQPEVKIFSTKGPTLKK